MMTIISMVQLFRAMARINFKHHRASYLFFGSWIKEQRILIFIKKQSTKQNKTHLNILQFLFLFLFFLFLVTICVNGEDATSFWPQNFASSLRNVKLKIKTIPNKNPKIPSLNPFFPIHNRTNDTTATQNDNALTNKSISRTFHDHKPHATQTKANTNHADFFILLPLPPLFPPRPPPTRRFRGSHWPRAISPAREFRGSGKILRLNAIAEASWRILRLDCGEHARLLAHTIVRDGWNCERRRHGKREMVWIVEIGNGRGWSEMEKGQCVLEM